MGKVNKIVIIKAIISLVSINKIYLLSMKSVSNIKLNLLLENVYIESSVNSLYENIAEYDDLYWIKNTNPNVTWDKNRMYYMDVSDMLYEHTQSTPISDWGELTILDILERMEDLGYDADISWYDRGEIKYLIFTPDVDDVGDKDYLVDYVTKEMTWYPTGDVTEITPEEWEVMVNNVIGESLIKESEEKSIIEDIVNELKIGKSFIFTFGTGIGALMEPVRELLEGSGVNLNQTQIILLIITSIALMLNLSKKENLIQKAKEEGIFQYLKGVLNFIKNIKNLINSVTKNVANAVYGLSDILGFTFLLVPSMKVITELINDYGITLDSVQQLFTGLISASAVYGVKSVVNKIRNRL